MVTAKLLAESIAGKSCPICLCRVVERTAAVVIPCNHAYCVECIRRWSNLKRKCPICNSEFDSWFFGLNLLSKTFQREKLPVAPAKDKAVFLRNSDVYLRRLRWVAERSRQLLGFFFLIQNFFFSFEACKLVCSLLNIIVQLFSSDEKSSFDNLIFGFCPNLIRIIRKDLETSSSRTRTLPWRRSFSRARDEQPDVIAERVLLWRARCFSKLGFLCIYL